MISTRKRGNPYFAHKLAGRRYFSMPVYEFYQKYHENGDSVWECECLIDGEEKSFFRKYF
jgi:hypothetical protein